MKSADTKKVKIKYVFSCVACGNNLVTVSAKLEGEMTGFCPCGNKYRVLQVGDALSICTSLSITQAVEETRRAFIESVKRRERLTAQYKAAVMAMAGSLIWLVRVGLLGWVLYYFIVRSN